MEFWAHVKAGPKGEPIHHELGDHSTSVSGLGGNFAASWGAGKWVELAGLWHDLGKYQEAFQRYIRSASGFDAHIETSPGKVKHAIAGAIHAVETLGNKGRLLAYLIAGHHAGLPDWLPGTASGGALFHELAGEQATLAQAKAAGIPAHILNPSIELPNPLCRQPGDMHFWLRMAYSCLVDADFLDTEAFMNPERASLRQAYPDVDTLCIAYDAYMAQQFTDTSTAVNRLRAEIRQTCLDRAADAPGLFSLTVPTGGGKTLASLGFALHHAQRHRLKRVIYVIPYTSIIEQTADVFRKVFAGIAPMPVIEHHSNLEVDHETPQSRIACENWDAPIVVTTNVQFFESLYAAKSSRCRKLHNIAESVVILDEAQLLPSEHLSPVIDSIGQLTKHYRTSLILSTATQPTLNAPRRNSFGKVELAGLGDVRELAPDPARLHRELERVSVSLPANRQHRRAWDELAAELADHSQVLCIVNRRNDAEALWRKLPQDESSIHLSARMCGAHRAQVIARIRQRLQDGQTVRVVSTQLVEAGVDLDFPVVYRAMAGLDSIAQAAGRCNREGRLAAKGRVNVFHPPKASPSGLLLKAEQAAERVLAGSSGEPLSPANYARYFDAFYSDVNSFDKEGVMDLLVKDASNGQIQFRSAAEKFRLIPDQGQRPVFVLWGEGEALINRLKVEGPHRELMRRLQRHTVTLHDTQWKALLSSGDLELHKEFLVQKSPTLYHEALGLLPEVPDYEPEALVG